VNVALARGVTFHRAKRLGPAVWVTLARATLVVGVAALTADSFIRPESVATLVTLAAVALAPHPKLTAIRQGCVHIQAVVGNQVAMDVDVHSACSSLF